MTGFNGGFSGGSSGGFNGGGFGGSNNNGGFNSGSSGGGFNDNAESSGGFNNGGFSGGFNDGIGSSGFNDNCTASGGFNGGCSGGGFNNHDESTGGFNNGGFGGSNDNGGFNDPSSDGFNDGGFNSGDAIPNAGPNPSAATPTAATTTSSASPSHNQPRAASRQASSDTPLMADCLTSFLPFGEAKDRLISTMREEAELMRVELQNALDQCRKLQRHIEREDESSLRLKKKQQEELERSNKEIIELRLKVASLNAQDEKRRQQEYIPCDELKRRQRQEARELQKVKTELETATAEKKALQQAWMDLDRQLDDVVKLKDSYQLKVNLLEGEVTSLKDKIGKLQAADSSNTELKKKLRTTEDDLNKLRQDNRSLKAELTDLKKANESYQLQLRSCMDLDRQLDDLVNLKDSYQSKANLLEGEVASWKDKLQAIDNSNMELKRKLRVTEEDLNKLRQENWSLNTELAVLKKANESCQLKLGSWTDLDRQLDDVIKQRDSYRLKVNQLEGEVASLKDEVNKLQTADNSNTESKRKLRATEDDLIKLRQDNRSLNGELTDLRKTKDSYQLQVVFLEKELSFLKDQVKKSQAADKNTTDFIKQLRVAEDDLDKMRHDNRSLNAELTDLKKANESYQHQIDLLKKEVSSLRELSFAALAPKPNTATDVSARLQMTEEHFGELRQDHIALQEELHQTEVKLKDAQEAYHKLYTGMQEAMDKIDQYKNDKEYFEKLYQSYKKKTEDDMLLKDAKVAQQEKLITHLQTLITAPKKMCCWIPDKKPAGRLSTDELGKALDEARTKNVELEARIRRLQQQLTEKRMMRRSFSEERLPVFNEH